ncbi:MAG: ribonuclease R [Nitrospinota bacterium]|nr:ribonuclease R [Nitrospinota bacterium]
MTDNELKNKLAKLLSSPMAMRDILTRLKVAGPDKMDVKQKIRLMAERGEILRLRGSRYGLPEKMDLVIGVVQGHNEGYGFVIPDDPDQEDLFLKAHNFHEVMHGDRVVARVEREKGAGRREGKVIRILERANDTVAGVLDRFRDGAYVVPFERRITQDIFIPPDKTLNAADGQAVMAKITHQPSKTRQAMGEVTEVLGDPEDPKVEIVLACARFHLRNRFPLDAIAQAKALSAPTGGPYPGREDFTARPIVTIDGESAKDFDDAVEVRRLPGGGWELGVHIADVAHYVEAGSPLDKEAALRGTSVYFPGSVVPMLPFELSNEICSLNPQVDRFTLSCVMILSADGAVKSHKLYESVIRPAERMTYTAVAAILEKEDPQLKERYAPLVPMFRDMGQLAQLLRERRYAAGALDFDLPEPEVILDITGRPENIIRAERNSAHKLIEEFMLLANRTVARHLFDKGIVIPNRVHEKPDPAKIAEFFDFITAFGIRGIEPDKFDSKWMAGILKSFSGRPEEKLVTHVMLRSMKQARYSAEARGHFALAFPHYAHFTSPIRRYPDLLTHRAVKRAVNNIPSPQGWDEGLEKISAHCSAMERNADDAERDIIKLKQTQHMATRIGEEFSGIISGVTNFGFFVELVDPAVEGLVRVSTIGDDYYHFDETSRSLSGARNGRTFRLGDQARVRVVEVSVSRRQIDFELLESRGRSGRPRVDLRRGPKPASGGGRKPGDGKRAGASRKPGRPDGRGARKPMRKKKRSRG